MSACCFVIFHPVSFTYVQACDWFSIWKVLALIIDQHFSDLLFSLKFLIISLSMFCIQDHDIATRWLQLQVCEETFTLLFWICILPFWNGDNLSADETSLCVFVCKKQEGIHIVLHSYHLVSYIPWNTWLRIRSSLNLDNL